MIGARDPTPVWTDVAGGKTRQVGSKSRPRTILGFTLNAMR